MQTDSVGYRLHIKKALLSTLPKYIVIDECKQATAQLDLMYIKEIKKWSLVYWVQYGTRDVEVIHSVRSKYLFKAVWKMQKKLIKGGYVCSEQLPF